MGIIAASRLRGTGINPMFDNAVAYYRLDETTGDAIDLVNAYNGTLSGGITRDGEYYEFVHINDHVGIPDEDDFSFTDGTDNTDFVIKTEVIFDNIKTSWLVSKRDGIAQGVQEWQLLFLNNEIVFDVFNSENNSFSTRTSLTPTVGQKYILGVTLNGTTISLFIDGVIEQNETLPNGFTFYNGNSSVNLGSQVFFSTRNLSLKGKLKETVIIKGSGWSQQNITDNYNNGNGITY
jgi:subtilisin family serine protease